MTDTSAFGALPEGFETFPDLWRDTCAPSLRALESKRRKAVLILGAGIGAGLLFLLTAMLMGGNLLVLLLAIVALGGLIWGWLSVRGVSRQAKDAMMAPMCEALSMRHTARGFSPPAFNELESYKMLPAHNTAKFEDLIEGEMDGAAFALCEAHLEERVRHGDEKKNVTVFRGLIGRLSHPVRVTSETVLTRDFGMFNALLAPRGMKKAGLGDPKFERTFELFTTDQMEARYLVTPLVMEQLLALEAEFKGKNIRAAFADGALYFALESGNLFEAGSPFSPYDNPQRMLRLVKELAAVRGLLMTLRGLKTGS